jgi:hypothetical protein
LAPISRQINENQIEKYKSLTPVHLQAKDIAKLTRSKQIKKIASPIKKILTPIKAKSPKRVTTPKKMTPKRATPVRKLPSRGASPRK